MKAFMSIAAAALMLGVVILPCTVFARESGEPVNGNLIMISSGDEFAKGELSFVETTLNIGDGALVLSEGQTDGEYISQVFETAPFEYLVASWNADTPAGTWVEISARAFVDMKGEWSEWASWGKWGTSIHRACTDNDNELVYIDTDVFTVKGSNGETASLVQLKATLHSDEAGVSPALRRVAATYKNTLDGQAIEAEYYGDTTELPDRVQLDTPAYSQMIREKSIAGDMCSACTITVLVNDRGLDLLPEEVALMAYDYQYCGFGNWPYSVAAAACYGYSAYVQYADFDILRQELAKGYSVGISVVYSASEGGSYPYLEGGAANSTGGHLITITGYERVDGVDYFFSSDSAATGDNACVRRYRADQLDECWRGRIAYIVHDKEAGAGFAAPSRLPAELVPVEGEEFTYSLVHNGEQIALPRSFLAKKLESSGTGFIAYSIDGLGLVEMPETTRTTSANGEFRYGVVMADGGNIKINTDAISKQIPEGADRTITLYVMVDDGTTYVSSMTIPEPVTETVAPETAAPETAEPVTDVPAEPAEDDVATAETTTEVAGTGMPGWGWALIAIGVVIAIAVAVIVIIHNKKA